MDMGLKGKVVAITGATAGIGKGLIPAFLAEGCQVAVCGRNEATCAAVQAEYPDVAVFRADVAKTADIQAFAAQTAARFGGIDVWINNAGVLITSLLTEMAEQDWDTMMDVNLKGVFIGCRTAVPYLQKRGGGVIINASSFASIMPSARSGAYAASKFGVNALTRTFAAELAPHNIRVVAYIPGIFDTPMNTTGLATRRAELTSQIALNRVGHNEDIAPAVVFLASPKAGYITGSSMEITGGKFCVQNPYSVWGE